MTGIQFMTDEAGRRTAVVIALKKHSALWEDLQEEVMGDAAIFCPCGCVGAAPSREGREDQFVNLSYIAPTDRAVDILFFP